MDQLGALRLRPAFSPVVAAFRKNAAFWAAERAAFSTKRRYNIHLALAVLGGPARRIETEYLC